MELLNTETLTFILALGSFILVALAPVINARQAHQERLEQQRREKEEKNEQRRKEQIDYYTERLNRLILLRTELMSATEHGRTVSAAENIRGILLSMPDLEKKEWAVTGGHGESTSSSEVRGICGEAIIRIGAILNELRRD